MVQVINVLATDFARKVADVELKATSKSELEGDIQLTPQQVQLLKGVNNIWTDGDEIELTYKA